MFALLLTACLSVPAPQGPSKAPPPVQAAVAVRGDAELTPADALASAEARVEEHVRRRWRDRAAAASTRHRPFWMPAALTEHATSRWLAELPGTHDRALSGPAVDPELVSYAPAQSARLHLDLRPMWRLALRRGSDKWILTDRQGLERYELSEDPHEDVDLIEVSPEAPLMLLEAGRRLEAHKAAALGGAQRDDDAVEALRELGYIE